MDRVFLDANVLFSAASRRTSLLRRLWRLKRVRLITSDFAIEEARRNLVDAGHLAELAELTRSLETVSTPHPLPAMPDGIALPDKNTPILASALRARATHLLTGDFRHFGRYFGRRPGGVLIQPPGEYLAEHA